MHETSFPICHFPPRGGPGLRPGLGRLRVTTAITGNGRSPRHDHDDRRTRRSGLRLLRQPGHLRRRLVQLDRDRSGPHAVNLCNLLGDDSKAAVYDGGCGTTVTWCNDDACSSSLVAFDATGQNYLIRIGNYADGSTAVFGDFTIDYAGPTLNPATGNYYQVITESLSWNGASAAPRRTCSTDPGHLVPSPIGRARLDPRDLNFDRPWIGLFHNTQASDYSEPAMGWQWVTGETSSFFNWSPGEPNNISGSGGPEDYCEMFGNGAWNDAEDFHGPTFEYIVEWEGGSIGTNSARPT